MSKTEDTELFELCKEVYKRFPEWYAVDVFYVKSFTKKDEYKNAVWELESYSSYSEHVTKKEFSHSNTVPLYTSDYLLEKLPDHVTIAGRKQGLRMMRRVMDADRPYYTRYMSRYGKQFETEADTLLKVLLKLVIALDDAGIIL